MKAELCFKFEADVFPLSLLFCTHLTTRHQDGVCEAALRHCIHRSPLRDDSHRVGVPTGGNRIFPEEEPRSEGGIPLHTAEDGDVLQSEFDFTLPVDSLQLEKMKVEIHGPLISLLFFFPSFFFF